MSYRAIDDYSGRSKWGAVWDKRHRELAITGRAGEKPPSTSSSSSSILCRPSFLRRTGWYSAWNLSPLCNGRTTRGGNTAPPLTSPCYNAIRSSLFVFPLASTPPRILPYSPPSPRPFSVDVSFWRTNGPSRFALPSRRNYNSSKCPTLHRLRRNPAITSILNAERKVVRQRKRESKWITRSATISQRFTVAESIDELFFSPDQLRTSTFSYIQGGK